MKQGAHIKAAIDILTETLRYQQPLAHIMAQWGKKNRYAGAKDRNHIANIVYTALRRKQSASWIMKNNTPRAIILAAIKEEWEHGEKNIHNIFDETQYAPEPLTQKEKQYLAQKNALDDAPDWVVANIPQWCEKYFRENFPDSYLKEGNALAQRAPVDIRCNQNKTQREKILKILKHLNPIPTPYAPDGIRIPIQKNTDKAPNLIHYASFQKGAYEIQDEGSQIMARLTDPKPNMQIFDLCAGAGGKTLALSSMMKNKGQIYAYDIDPQRLSPIYSRIKRAGARNIQVRHPKENTIDDLKQKMDIVILDTPCSGTGTWRRRPDIKWKLKENHLSDQCTIQSRLLQQATQFVKIGGAICYITCSMLKCENQDQITRFLTENPNYEPENIMPVIEKIFQKQKPFYRYKTRNMITLSPYKTKTDGFFFAMMRRHE